MTITSNHIINTSVGQNVFTTLFYNRYIIITIPFDKTF